MTKKIAIRFVLLSLLVSFAGVMRPAAGPSEGDSQTALFNRLMTAIGDRNMIAMLDAINYGANFNQVDRDGLMPLDYAYQVRNYKAVNILERCGAVRYVQMPREIRSRGYEDIQIMPDYLVDLGFVTFEKSEYSDSE